LLFISLPDSLSILNKVNQQVTFNDAHPNTAPLRRSLQSRNSNHHKNHQDLYSWKCCRNPYFYWIHFRWTAVWCPCVRNSIYFFPSCRSCSLLHDKYAKCSTYRHRSFSRCTMKLRKCSQISHWCCWSFSNCCSRSDYSYLTDCYYDSS